MPAVNERSVARLALVPEERRREIARAGGLARSAKASPAQKRVIALLGVAGRLAKRRESALK